MSCSSCIENICSLYRGTTWNVGKLNVILLKNKRPGMKIKCILLGCMIKHFGPHFFSIEQQPTTAQLGFRPPQCWCFYNTHRHIPVRTPLNGTSTHHRGCYLHNTQQTHETKIYAFGGIQIRNSSYQAASDLHLRPHCQQDWLTYTLQIFL